MKIALAALAFEDKNIRRNQQTILQAMEQYSGQADLLVFGETFLQGFDVLTWDYEKDRIIAVEEHDPVIEEIAKAAAEYHIAVSFGFIGRCGEKLYSSQLTIGADGKKVNLFRQTLMPFLCIQTVMNICGQAFDVLALRELTKLFFWIGLIARELCMSRLNKR